MSAAGGLISFAAYSNLTTMANQLLKGKKGIISGALNNMSIAWKVAERAHEEGAEIVLTNAPIAMRMGEINGLAAAIGNAPIIPADATNEQDIENLFARSMEHFGVRWILCCTASVCPPTCGRGSIIPT